MILVPMPTPSLLTAAHCNTLQQHCNSTATALQQYCNTDDIGANANEGPFTGATSDSIRFTLQLTATTNCNNAATTLQQHGNNTATQMILVPMPTKGLRLVRPLTVFGYDDAPHGHAEVEFKGDV